MDRWTRFRLATLTCVLFVIARDGAAERRALLVGINDYTASRFERVRTAAAPERDWPNLHGTLNDVATIREMLALLYGFQRRDVEVLTNQQATRGAILQALEQLAASASKDDVLLFYYAGHGSQVRNSASDEPDGLDESLVPADSRAGAPDIRDKELRPLFNRMLDRGARLTVILDNCHSGSGARGLWTGAQPRGVAADLRDVADRSRWPRPEDRGALVLSATQDFDRAWETRDEQGRMHGAFSWAWIRAMRDSAPGEPAMETFLRAQARLRAETPYQEPVLAGDDAARLRPFLGARIDRREGRLVVGVERLRADGTVVLQGGWANGLAVGSELRGPRSDARVVITAIRGLGRAEGRVTAGQLRSGALLEVTGWATPPARPLRIFVSASSGDVLSLARLLSLESNGTAAEADYVLMGRFRDRRMSYAWVRPSVSAADCSPLPARTAWVDSPEELNAALNRLRRIHSWQTLESPPQSRSPYRLALRRERDGQLATSGVVTGEEKYSLVLRTSAPRVAPRYFYVFTVDNHGRSTLLFPRSGSVENRFPSEPPAAPPEILLGDAAAFEPAAPYGIDTYYLLSTDEPLPNPWILEWDAVRSPPPAASTPLEELLLLTASNARSTRLLTPATWSLEKLLFRSVPPM